MESSIRWLKGHLGDLHHILKRAVDLQYFKWNFPLQTKPCIYIGGINFKGKLFIHVQSVMSDTLITGRVCTEIKQLTS